MGRPAQSTAAAAVPAPVMPPVLPPAAAVLVHATVSTPDPPHADARASSPAAGSRLGGGRRSTTLQSVDEEGLTGASSGALHASPFSASSPDFSFEEGGRSSPSLSGEPSLPGGMLLPEGSAAGLSQQEDSYVRYDRPARTLSPGYGSSSSPERQHSPERLQQEFQQLTDVQCQRALDAEFGQSAEARPAPPMDPAMQHVLEFGLPCQPSDFWCYFLCNSSDFLTSLHARRGDKNMRISKWQRHYKARQRPCPAHVYWRAGTWRLCVHACALLACLPACLLWAWDSCGSPRCSATGKPELTRCSVAAATPGPNPQVGLVRDLQFVSPVKARIGPPQAVCHQTQRLQVGQRLSLVLLARRAWARDAR